MNTAAASVAIPRVSMPATSGGATPATQETVEISFKNFQFYYGKYHALKNINLDIYTRRVTAFIGPSGCGKSTLLRTLNRMYDLYPEQRAEGELLFNGRNMIEKDVDLNDLRARVGMVFQKPTPFPMSIYDNIAFGVRLHERMSKGEMDDSADETSTSEAGSV